MEIEGLNILKNFSFVVFTQRKVSCGAITIKSTRHGCKVEVVFLILLIRRNWSRKHLLRLDDLGIFFEKFYNLWSNMFILLYLDAL